MQHLAEFFPFDPYKAASWATGIGAWIGLLAYAIYKRFGKAKAEDKYGDASTLKNTSHLDSRIHELLSELRSQAQCCRAVIYEFHNGEKFFSGSPIQRMTCTYESVAGGYASVVDGQRAGIVVSHMSAVLDLMFDDTPLVQEVEALPDTFSKNRFQSLNITYFAALPLYQDKHKIVGCLKLHWAHTRISDDKWLRKEMLATINSIELLFAERQAITGTHS